MAIISILMEVFMGELDSFFIVLLNSNFIALFCIIFGVYKNYNTYRKKDAGKLVMQMIKTISPDASPSHRCICLTIFFKLIFII